MFGFLCAEREQLTAEEDIRYKQAYCGLCHSLRERYGEICRFTLNYDMTFLILLLNSLYEEETITGTDKCPVHPRKGSSWLRCTFTDYAADMNIALSCLSLQDDWDDEGRLLGKIGSDLLKKRYAGLRERYPRQCASMEQCIFDLHIIEQENREDADAAAACFGRMMGDIFCIGEDRWQKTMYAFAFSLGKFLYILDACIDLDKDTRKNSYNPFRRCYGLPDNRERFYDILKMLLGDCVYYFDQLPLVQDVGILKNVLCFGLWTEFNRKFGTEERNDGSGSI